MSTLEKPNGKKQFERACRVIPGGLMSNFRKEEGYVPTYFARGEGSRLYDIDGNEFLDYSLSYGPAILGHNPPAVMRAVAEQLSEFSSCENTLRETEAAELLVKHVPCAELVRFACSGTEAVYNACRIARAHTGRDKIVRFNGHYDGGLDELIGGVVRNANCPVPQPGELEDDYFSQLANTAGRAPHALSDTFMIEWNDRSALEDLFKDFGEEIAGVLMEPTMVNVSGCLPEPGFLESARALCDKNGAVLIFDEVITGFRIGLGGAQEAFGVTPDLATFAKALGGGFPVSGFCGKREIMDCVTRAEVIAGGTYNGHPLAMAAVVATISELARDDAAALKTIIRLGTLLGDGLREIFARYDAKFTLQGFPGAWTLAWHPHRNKIINHGQSLGIGYFDHVGAFIAGMNQRGVIMQSRMCTSAAHREEDVEQALDAAEDTVKWLQSASAAVS